MRHDDSKSVAIMSIFHGKPYAYGANIWYAGLRKVLQELDFFIQELSIALPNKKSSTYFRQKHHYIRRFK